MVTAVYDMTSLILEKHLDAIWHGIHQFRTVLEHFGVSMPYLNKGLNKLTHGCAVHISKLLLTNSDLASPHNYNGVQIRKLPGYSSTL